MKKEVHIFKALSHPTRLEIIKILSNLEFQCVCKIQELLDISQSSLSQHLKILKDSEIVTNKKVGSWVHYSLKNEKILDIISLVEEI